MNAVTPFAQAIETLQPGAGGRAIAKLLDGRATRHAALNWKAGRRAAPQWALQLLAGKIQQRAESQAAIAAKLNAMPERLGLRAGAHNLTRWRARL